MLHIHSLITGLKIFCSFIGDDTITVTNTNNEDDYDYKKSSSKTWQLIFVDDKENKENWAIYLLQHAADHRRWKKAAIARMEIFSPAKGTKKDRSTSSLGNNEPLYERITLKTNTLTRKATVKKTKSFKRTKSKLTLIYNQTGGTDEVIGGNKQILI